MADQKAGFTRQAGLGPWTELGDHGLRLTILGQVDEHRQVLAQVSVLLA